MVFSKVIFHLAQGFPNVKQQSTVNTLMHKGSFKKYVRWGGGEGEGVIEKRTKTNRGCAGKQTRANKGEGGGVKTWESWANVLFECPLTCQKGQAHFKNLEAFAARFLKSVWPLWDAMH